MRFKLDENLPAELLAELREAGHDADTVVDEGLTGAPDSVILEEIKPESKVLLTMDKGIGNIRTYSPQEYAGIVLFRPPTSGRGTVFQFVRRHLRAITELDLEGRLVVRLPALG